MKLIVDNLQKNYGKKEVLKGINFEFESGKIYGLLGVNGSGKTTFSLLSCLVKEIIICLKKLLLNDIIKQIYLRSFFHVTT